MTIAVEDNARVRPMARAALQSMPKAMPIAVIAAAVIPT